MFLHQALEELQQVEKHPQLNDTIDQVTIASKEMLLTLVGLYTDARRRLLNNANETIAVKPEV